MCIKTRNSVSKRGILYSKRGNFALNTGLELGPGGVEEISWALRDAVRATALKEIHWEFNDMGDGGAITVVKALAGEFYITMMILQ